MDRAWQATVHGVARVGHDLVMKPPPPPCIMIAPLQSPCIVPVLVHLFFFASHEHDSMLRFCDVSFRRSSWLVHRFYLVHSF